MNAQRAQAAALVPLHVDGRACALRGPTATGAQIKALAARGAASRLFRERGVLEAKAAADAAIADGDVVPLRDGMRFYTISEARVRDSVLHAVPWRAGSARRLRLRAGVLVGLAGLWIVAGRDRAPPVVRMKLAVATWALVALAAWSWPPRRRARRKGQVLVLTRPWQKAFGLPSLPLLMNAVTFGPAHLFAAAGDAVALLGVALELIPSIRWTQLAMEQRFLRRRATLRWSEVAAVTLERDVWWNPGVLVLRGENGPTIRVAVALNGFCEFAGRALASVPAPAFGADPPAKEFLEAVAPLAALPDGGAAPRALVRG